MVEITVTNGKEIYEAILNIDEKITIVKVDIATIKTRQEERHNENINKFDTLFNKINNIPNVKDVKKDINRLYWLVFVVIILGLFMKLGG